MDEIDLIILKELQKNSRKPLNEISRSANLSMSAVSERIRKLECERIIKHYATILDPEKFGKTLTCFCFVSLEGKSKKTDERFYEFIRNEPDIISCHCLTGHYEYLLKITTGSTKSLESLLAKMRHDALVKLTNTYVVLSTVKDLPSVPPAAAAEPNGKKSRRAKYG